MPLYPWLVRVLGLSVGTHLARRVNHFQPGMLWRALLLFYEVAFLKCGYFRILPLGELLSRLFSNIFFFLFTAYTDLLFLAIDAGQPGFFRAVGNWLARRLVRLRATLLPGCRAALLGLVLLWAFLAEGGVENGLYLSRGWIQTAGN